MRGPEVLPSTPGRPARRSRRERFDAIALSVVADVDRRWQDRLGLVEYAVEEAPDIPEDWDDTGSVPLSALVRGSGTTPTRLVLFRGPIEHRCEGRDELVALVLTLVVEHLADLLGVDPAEIDPRYEPGD